MPHFIIEVAEPLLAEYPAKLLIEHVKQAANKSQLFTPDDIKCRVQPFEIFDCGQEGMVFIHVVAKLLSGRTLAQRKYLSSEIVEQLQRLAVSNISITAEIVEIEKESYTKHVTLAV